MKNYSDISSVQLLDIILQDREQSDEAMYHILTDRLSEKLRLKYREHNSTLSDNFEDVIDDFFLYLREDKAERPYQALRTIRNKDTFEAWIVSTFRNFLTAKAAKTHQFRTTVGQSVTNDSNDKESLFRCAAYLIAYSHQELPPRSQFILLRTLLTLLDKSNALSDSEMAQAMGMTHTLYRVTSHRTMKNVKMWKERIESEGKPDLDQYHETMAEEIYNDFDSLYPTLVRYYDATLTEQEKALSITALRTKHYERTGYMLHENRIPYHGSDALCFYNELCSYLNSEAI